MVSTDGERHMFGVCYVEWRTLRASLTQLSLCFFITNAVHNVARIVVQDVQQHVVATLVS